MKKLFKNKRESTVSPLSCVLLSSITLPDVLKDLSLAALLTGIAKILDASLPLEEVYHCVPSTIVKYLDFDYMIPFDKCSVHC